MTGEVKHPIPQFDVPTSERLSNEISSFKPPNHDELIRPMLQTHNSGLNKTLSWRIHQISSMKAMITNHKEEFCTALYQDLHREYTEAVYTEIALVCDECDRFISRLKTWMEAEYKSTPGVQAPCFTELRRVPLKEPGCLIVSPFNYPLGLSLVPVVGCLGGGNPAVLKPSELSPMCSSLLAKLVPQYFDPGAFQIVQGGSDVSSSLLKHNWGLIFFTGSENVGKIVACEAAKTLTPVVLELGGKCPAYVASDCPDNMDVVANRLLWSKTMNCGQTCIATDYVVCHESKVQELCQELKKSLKRMFGEDAKNSELGRIVNVAHAKRLTDFIKEVEVVKDDEKTQSTKTEIVAGGSSFCHIAERFVSPTIVLNPPIKSRLMTEEIFGPILPIVTVRSEEEAIDIIKNVPGTPLSLYVYTKSSSVYERIINSCQSSSAIRNDAIINFSNMDVPFGGFGSSGYGSCHGRYSFETFTHKFPSIYKPCHPMWEYLGFRYHPYGTGLKSKLFIIAMTKLPPIPVLHIRMLFVILFLFVVMTLIPTMSGAFFSEEILNMIADVLDALAASLRTTR